MGANISLLKKPSASERIEFEVDQHAISAINFIHAYQGYEKGDFMKRLEIILVDALFVTPTLMQNGEFYTTYEGPDWYMENMDTDDYAIGVLNLGTTSLLDDINSYAGEELPKKDAIIYAMSSYFQAFTNHITDRESSIKFRTKKDVLRDSMETGDKFMLRTISHLNAHPDSIFAFHPVGKELKGIKYGLYARKESPSVDLKLIK